MPFLGPYGIFFILYLAIIDISLNNEIRKILEIILPKLKFSNVTTVSARFSFFFAHTKHKECPGVKEVH